MPCSNALLNYNIMLLDSKIYTAEHNKAVVFGITIINKDSNNFIKQKFTYHYHSMDHFFGVLNF